MILGITGGVGAGKSTVLAYLKETWHAFVIECDEVARLLQEPGEACYAPMLQLFSEDAQGVEPLLDPDGRFNRKEVARRVFQDPEKLRELNRIVHPAVKRRVRSLIEEARARGEAQGGKEPLIVIEAALLLEDNYGEICDEIWYIYADENVRRMRLKKSRGYTDEKITEMFASQRSEESFRESCSLTIDNSSENLQNTFRQIDEAIDSLKGRRKDWTFTALQAEAAETVSISEQTRPAS